MGAMGGPPRAEKTKEVSEGQYRGRWVTHRGEYGRGLNPWVVVENRPLGHERPKREGLQTGFL